MQLVTFRQGQAARLGAVWHDTVLDLAHLARDMAAIAFPRRCCR
jgi:hypothetical protein